MERQLWLTRLVCILQEDSFDGQGKSVCFGKTALMNNVIIKEYLIGKSKWLNNDQSVKECPNLNSVMNLFCAQVKSSTVLSMSKNILVIDDKQLIM